MFLAVTNDKPIKPISIPEDFNTYMTFWYQAEY